MSANQFSSSLTVWYVFIEVGIISVYILAFWRLYKKAGRNGWECLIPFYNLYILLQIAGRPGWWMILYLIPFVNIVIHLLVSIDLAKAFGKSSLFGILGLWLFSFIGYAVLGFGKSIYTGPGNSTQQPPSAPLPKQTIPQSTQ